MIIVRTYLKADPLSLSCESRERGLMDNFIPEVLIRHPFLFFGTRNCHNVSNQFDASPNCHK